MAAGRFRPPFTAEIDFVWHDRVEAIGDRMVAVLNKHWNDPEIPPATWPDPEDDE